ncbi:DUF2889 domain-containing protein [Candidimonas nitroreducens]|uniref:DUF2889 domain-containing protein n=1 Tax=Candidimonas nitroreducens TaxID=683354 RepID=A0A225MCI8_9BURK|nr:hypothetical protein CEY11_12260 [Candidimonas nitroreducens]
MSVGLPPANYPRRLMHIRTIECCGYERDDGLWDIEGRLTDRKTHFWPQRAGERDLPAGDPAHDMRLRLTIDLDMVIQESYAYTAAGPYGDCGAMSDRFALLKGRRIARGWTKDLARLVGGVYGCTHQWELLSRVAAVAYQSTNGARNKRRGGQMGTEPPRNLNTCHMYASTSPVVFKRWPEYYTPSTELPTNK